ncbi:FAD-dependent oxidoreductase [Devosia riboflavina]|uniref:FAD-dependent oxidoreductase n=1 Tax=Devosia riboflavina TaxID=46914 RepID=A0A087M322_9HYPH|nr:NAD(P)/FAD-dependent oxidoreductase [Devosia riboflavina]KFL31275.1 FAD-dependent oxidoreductase [Devosia riboflavina]
MPELAVKSNCYDVAIVGGGVVGCAVARRLTLDGARVVLIEKGADILSGASKANSALLHTGFDAPAGSLELQCMQAGYAEYLAIRAELNLPLLETGGMVIAWNEEQLSKLDGILAQAHGNGVGDAVLVDGAAVAAREPHLAPSLGAVLVPGEHVIDPWSAPLAYLTQAVVNGAEFLRSTEVIGGRFADDEWALDTSSGPLRARFVVNCAGLFGDRLEASLLGDAHFSIKPRKGQFLVFDKMAAKLMRTIILPVPTERTKGVVLARTAFGNVLVGPTAEEQDDRVHARTDEATLEILHDAAVAMIPELADVPVNAIYAGLRPASEQKHYRIRREDGRQFLTLGGIRSTGLTAALGLAQFAAGELRAMGLEISALAEPVVKPMPNISEMAPRDWQAENHGTIICHCELVTEREIAATFDTAVPPGDLGGLKRRTRACMGRCQGFYCSANVARLSEGRLDPPMAAAS